MKVCLKPEIDDIGVASRIHMVHHAKGEAPGVKLTGDGARYFEERKSADSTSSFWFHASLMSS